MAAFDQWEIIVELFKLLSVLQVLKLIRFHIFPDVFASNLNQFSLRQGLWLQEHQYFLSEKNFNIIILNIPETLSLNIITILTNQNIFKPMSEGLDSHPFDRDVNQGNRIETVLSWRGVSKEIDQALTQRQRWGLLCSTRAFPPQNQHNKRNTLHPTGCNQWSVQYFSHFLFRNNR